MAENLPQFSGDGGSLTGYFKKRWSKLGMIKAMIFLGPSFGSRIGGGPGRLAEDIDCQIKVLPFTINKSRTFAAITTLRSAIIISSIVVASELLIVIHVILSNQFPIIIIWTVIFLNTTVQQFHMNVVIFIIVIRT